MQDEDCEALWNHTFIKSGSFSGQSKQLQVKYFPLLLRLHLNCEKKRQTTDVTRLQCFLTYDTLPFLLTVILGGMLGLWASAGFFMRAGLVAFGDIDARLPVSPFPSVTSLRGTPAKS